MTALHQTLAEANWLLREYEEIIVALALGTLPAALERKNRIIGMLSRRDLPLPDELHEQALRQGLGDRPDDAELTFSLVALLVKLGRAPLPEASTLPRHPIAHAGDARIDEDLLSYTSTGDTLGALTLLWRAARRTGDSMLTWIRFADFFVDRGQFDHAMVAFDQGLDAPGAESIEALDTLGYVAARLAEAGRIDHARLGSILPMVSSVAAPEVVRHRGNLLRILGDARSAAATLEPVALKAAHDAWTSYLGFRAQYADGNTERAYGHLRQALARDPVRIVGEILRHTGAVVSTLVSRLERSDELGDWLTDIFPHTPGIHVIPPYPTPESRASTAAQRVVALDRGLPSAVLVAQGKSGSVAMAQILAHGFQLANVAYALTVSRVVLPWVADMVRGGACRVTHLAPRDINVRLLADAGVGKVFVHVRDPRGQLVSLVHHYRRYGTQNALFDARWARMSVDEQIEYCLIHHLTKHIDWISGWLAARDRLTLHFTTYEAFVGDKARFVESMLEHYGGNTAYFDRDAALGHHGGIDYHFRRGEAESWRDELSPAQIETINRAMPDDFWRTFGWNP